MRVIAGRLGGRRLIAPGGASTRPTSDRVREALFSVLGDMEGACVLDLYAGTGALGIEALSRGALKAVFVEDARAALLSLQENLRALHLQGGAAVIQRPVERAAAAILAHAPFDFVFADPPYAKTDQAAAALWELVGRGNLLAPFGRVIIEHARRRPAPEIPGLRCMETRAYGDTSISIYACEPT